MPDRSFWKWGKKFELSHDEDHELDAVDSDKDKLPGLTIEDFWGWCDSLKLKFKAIKKDGPNWRWKTYLLFLEYGAGLVRKAKDLVDTPITSIGLGLIARGIDYLAKRTRVKQKG